MQVDRPFFEELVRRHHAAVYRTARRVVGSDADAEDVVQQVFVRVLQGKADLPAAAESAGPALRWLAGRLALNHLRAARRRRVHEEGRAMATTGTTERTAEQEDDGRAVRDAMGALPDELRVPLALRFHDGMTLAAVAGVLGCAESTAHARVQRGLEALRAQLQRLGFAALAVRVEAVLPGTAAAVAVPSGLEASLLGLSAPAVAGLGAKLAAAALALVVLGAGGALAVGAFDGSDARPEADARAAITSEDAGSDSAAGAVRGVAGLAAGRTEVATAGSAPQPSALTDQDPDADLPTCRLTGRAFDPDTGYAIDGARVTAASEESRGKGARFTVGATTDRSGAFALDVPVAHDGGQAYRVVVTASDRVPFRSERLVAKAGEALSPLPCALRRWAADVEGEWEMEVVVTDEHGTPVPSAVVTVLRRRPNPGVAERHPHEAGGKVDRNGRVTLHGDHHGEKLLQVRALDGNFGPAEIALRLDDPGPHVRRVVLGPGRTISGVATAVDGGAPIEGVWIEAQVDGDAMARGRADEAGRFTIRGLGEGAYDLGGHPLPWSPFRIEGVRAGAEDVAIRLKQYDDPRAHGEFLGEIHGRIVDAETGAPVAVLPYRIRTYWLSPEITDWRRELLPSELTPAPVQTAQMSVGEAQTEEGQVVLRRPRKVSEFHEVGMRAGRYLVLVYSPDHAMGFAGPFEVGPGRLVSEVVVELPRGVTVEGTVRDAAGTPVEGAVVWVGAATAAADELRAAVARTLAETGGAVGARFGVGRYRTDADGSFTIPRVAPGLELRVHAAHPGLGHAGSGAVVLHQGEGARRVDLTLSRR